MSKFSFFGKSSSSRTSKSGQTSKPLELEALEDRSLLSCSVISGYVYQDANNNGLFDAGELPVANSTMQLRDATNQVVASATTDAQGYYEFAYDSTIIATPATLEKTVNFPKTQTNYSLEGLVDQFDPSLGQLQSIEIVHEGAITSEIKVENTSSLSGSTITGTVGGSLTLDGPGIHDVINLAENVGTITVSKYDSNLDFAGTSGNSFGSQTTADDHTLTLTGPAMQAFQGTGQVKITESATASSSATGGGNLVVSLVSSAEATIKVIYHYLPNNCLKPGNYTIVQTKQPTGFIDGQESRDGVVLTNTPGVDTILLTLVDDDLPNNNFGELLAPALSGYVYVDSNNNGIKDVGEPGISGVALTLTGTNDTGNVTRTGTTDSSGFYQFNDLRPGTYSVQETQPTSHLDGKDAIGSAGGAVSNDLLTAIRLNSGTQSVNNNFGEVVPASISGFVYLDANDNGIKDPGEQGIAGVQVALGGSNDQGVVNQTAVTNSSGFYQFQNLLPGNYTLGEAQPSAYLDGKDAIGSQGGQASNDAFSGIPLPSGTQGVNNNFGELNFSSLSGYVYVDVNNNGIKDPGEAPIAGVMVSLTGNDDAGPVNRSATTDASGFYQFQNLRGGTYTLSETQPIFYLDGKDALGSLNGNLTNDNFSSVILPANSQGINYNFGELNSSSLSGYVYVDANNNGIKDPNEVPIAGVTMALGGSDDLGQVTRTTTTDANGFYQFGNLRPGTYTLSEAQPGIYLDGKDAVGSLNGALNNDQLSAIAVPQDTQGTNYNFGELTPASLSGYVYVDKNENGTKDAGENALSGVSITLTGSNDLGQVNRATTTDANGFYQFGNLRPGTYIITETQPGEYGDGQESLGSLGGTTTNDQFSGVPVAMGDQGVNYNFGEVTRENSDLAITKTVDNSVVYVGNNLTYTLTVTNLGAFTANQVVVQDTLPPEATYVSAFGPGWNITVNGNTLVATTASLPVGVSSVITITVKAPLTTTTLLNSTQVSSSTPDKNPNNNQASATSIVLNKPGITYTKVFELQPVTFQRIYIAGKGIMMTATSGSSVPTSSGAMATYIDGLYRTLTGQSPSTNVLISTLNSMTSGSLTVKQLVTQVWNSDAHRKMQANTLYQTFYDRLPTASEQTATVSALKAGATEHQLAIQFLNSAEYLQMHPNALSLVAGIYQDVIGTVPDLGTLTANAQAMSATSWSAFVESTMNSTSAWTQIVQDGFAATVRRAPTATELQTWVSKLQSNQVTAADFLQTLMGSQEFYTLVNSLAK